MSDEHQVRTVLWTRRGENGLALAAIGPSQEGAPQSSIDLLCHCLVLLGIAHEWPNCEWLSPERAASERLPIRIETGSGVAAFTIKRSWERAKRGRMQSRLELARAIANTTGRTRDREIGNGPSWTRIEGHDVGLVQILDTHCAMSTETTRPARANLDRIARKGPDDSRDVTSWYEQVTVGIGAIFTHRNAPVWEQSVYTPAMHRRDRWTGRTLVLVSGDNEAIALGCSDIARSARNAGDRAIDTFRKILGSRT